MASRAPVEFSADAKQFQKMLADVGAFDKKLVSATRKQIRTIANEFAAKSRAEVMKPPPKHVGYTRKDPKRKSPPNPHYPASRGTRQALADGIKVQILNGKSKAGAYIVSSGKSPEAKKLRAKWDNSRGWRHPVYPRRKPREEWTWATQKGRPYFRVFVKREQPKLEAAIRAAVEEALADVARRIAEQGHH